jgi:hypothetical protein
MMTMFTTPRLDRIDHLINSIVQGTAVPLLVAGNAANFQITYDSDRIIHVPEPMELVSYLRERKGYARFW